MDTAGSPIGRLLGAYEAAVLAKDANAFMQLYDPDVRVFDTWGIWSYEGAPAWRRMVEDWFASLGSERVRVSFEDVEVTSTAELALASAIVTYAGLSPDNVELRSMQNRMTWVLRPDGSSWKVVHEHTSVPVDFDHARAILERGGK